MTLHLDLFHKILYLVYLEVEKLQEAKVIIADPNTAPLHLSKLPQLKWMQLTWAGIDAVTQHLTPQQRSSLLLTRFGGVFGPHMAQYVIGHIISWEREFRKMWTDQQHCKWYIYTFQRHALC